MGAGPRPRPRGGAPGRQAGQRHPRARLRPGDGHRLRDRPPGRTGSCRRREPRHRDAAVHESGAGGRPGHRRAERPLLARGHGVLRRDRPAAVRVEHRGGLRDETRKRGTAPVGAACPAAAGPIRRRRGSVPRQGSDRTLSNRRGARGRDRGRPRGAGARPGRPAAVRPGGDRGRLGGRRLPARHDRRRGLHAAVQAHRRRLARHPVRDSGAHGGPVHRHLGNADRPARPDGPATAAGGLRSPVAPRRTHDGGTPAGRTRGARAARRARHLAHDRRGRRPHRAGVLGDGGR